MSDQRRPTFAHRCGLRWGLQTFALTLVFGAWLWSCSSNNDVAPPKQSTQSGAQAPQTGNAPVTPGTPGPIAAGPTDPGPGIGPEVVATPGSGEVTPTGGPTPAAPALPGANPAPTSETTTSTGPVEGPSVVEDEDTTIIETTPPVSTVNHLPLNLGSETTCDDMDENSNGIIDDVDVGKDGLCDCIHIGFFGEISSDAGMKTASFEAWLVARSGQVPIKHLAANETLTADWLASLQVLIVGGMQDRAAAGGKFTAEEVAAFDDWVQNRGGGVITLSGYTASSDDARPTNELLVNTGLSYQLTGVPMDGVIGDGAPPNWLTGIVAPDHPTVDQVSQIGVYYAYPVKGDGTVILREGTYDLAMAKEVGMGKVFIFSDEWITQDATWAGLSDGQSMPCQQPCNEQQNSCRIASEQCTQCEMAPCSDPNDTDAGTCAKGCQPSCENETMRCQTNTDLCTACQAEADARAEATPRLWLNTIRWLTPTSECKVDIPPSVRVR